MTIDEYICQGLLCVDWKSLPKLSEGMYIINSKPPFVYSKGVIVSYNLEQIAVTDAGDPIYAKSGWFVHNRG